MKSYSELWEMIGEVAAHEGLALFDLELSGSLRDRKVRVFISSPDRDAAPVTLDMCARVSRRLQDVLEVESGMEDFSLEVSSPGINRRLRLPQHFQKAVGERVKISVSDPSAKGGVIRGVLKGFDGKILSIDDEHDSELREVALSEVHKAHIDFQF